MGKFVHRNAIKSGGVGTRGEFNGVALGGLPPIIFDFSLCPSQYSDFLFTFPPNCPPNILDIGGHAPNRDLLNSPLVITHKTPHEAHTSPTEYLL